MRVRVVLIVGLGCGILTAQTPSQGVGSPLPVRAHLVAPGDPAGGAILYHHQDCIDEVAGLLGVRGHGTHASAPFVAPASTMNLSLDPINLGTGGCLATAAADLPPRNAYVGHFEFVLRDVHTTAVPNGEPRERFRCEYIGVPLEDLGTFTCSGLQTFYGGRNHTITIIVEPSAPLLGIPVPSVGAIELTVSS